jgi:hypothetical protein
MSALDLVYRQKELLTKEVGFLEQEMVNIR